MNADKDTQEAIEEFACRMAIFIYDAVATPGYNTLSITIPEQIVDGKEQKIQNRIYKFTPLTPMPDIESLMNEFIPRPGRIRGKPTIVLFGSLLVSNEFADNLDGSTQLQAILDEVNRCRHEAGLNELKPEWRCAVIFDTDTVPATNAADRVIRYQLNGWPKNKMRPPDSTIALNRMELQAEETECAKRWLDEHDVPRCDATGRKYSLVGRIKLYGSKQSAASQTPSEQR